MVLLRRKRETEDPEPDVLGMSVKLEGLLVESRELVEQLVETLRQQENGE